MSGTSETFMRAGSDRAKRLWSIVLAGGEGRRLRPLIRHLYGEDRPKQYCSLFGSRSLLGATLDRVARKVPLEKTLVVTSRWHSKYAEEEFGSAAKVKLLVQPRDRGTAAGVLFPVHWVRRQDPDAVVAVFPSDHFVADECAFMNHVEKLAVLAGRHIDRLFLVGARPSAPDIGYGWIEPSEDLDGAGLVGVSGVRRFWEKLSGEIARFCFERGYLWNTFVMVGSASVFLEAGRRHLPRLDRRLSRAAPFIDTKREPRVVDRAYASAPRADFSHAILEEHSPLAVSQLPAVGWSDWGTPERVIGSLKTAGISPPWLRRLSLSA